MVTRNEVLYDRPGYHLYKVPCGKCPPCVKKRSSQWIFRLKQEHKIAISSKFLTLTYEDEYLHFTKSGRPTLHHADHQRFIKRLRKRITKENLVTRVPLRYYAVGEYGSRTQRPHFHSITFNIPKNLDDDIIREIWGHGNVMVGTVTGRSMAYVTGYIQKQIGHSKDRKDDDRSPERSFISKGIGQNYITSQIKEYYKKQLSPYLRSDGGQKIPLPRYYKDRLYTQEEQRIVNEKAALYLDKEITDFKKDFETKANEIRKRDRYNKQFRQTV